MKCDIFSWFGFKMATSQEPNTWTSVKTSGHEWLQVPIPLHDEGNHIYQMGISFSNRQGNHCHIPFGLERYRNSQHSLGSSKKIFVSKKSILALGKGDQSVSSFPHWHFFTSKGVRRDQEGTVTISKSVSSANELAFPLKQF